MNQPVAPTVDSLLAGARTLAVDRLDAEVLLTHVLGCRRTWLLAHGEATLSREVVAGWTALASRRGTGEPLAYLVGTKEFHGLMLVVDRRVLVPRPDTETLVDVALGWLSSHSAAVRALRVLDLGTGSGAIAVAVKTRFPTAQVFASDLSADALDVARANAGQLGCAIDFRCGSWWQPWAHERFDLVVANPPYIASGDPHLDALRHEPGVALVAGHDGLAALQMIVAGARSHLEAGGALWLEHGHDQAAAVFALLDEAGFVDIDRRSDLGGNPRCSGGCISP